MTNATILKKLKQLPLFSKTASPVLEDWLKTVPSPRIYPSGARIDDGEPSLGVLLHGWAEITSADTGKSVLLRKLTAPGVFGAASLFCPEAPNFSRTEAKTACTVLQIPLDAVRALLSLDESFRDAYLTFLSGRVRFLNQKIRAFTAGSADRRLALWLISEESDVITLPTSISSLADMLDIGRASLYRALDKLEEEGLITRKGRTITLLSPSEIYQKYNA